MATFTIGDVIADARVELGDTYEGSYAYPTADMVRYAGEAIVELRSLRPSTRYDVDTGKLLDDDDKWLALIEDEVSLYPPVSARYRKTLAAYLVFKCLSRDETDKGNRDRADVAFKRFTDTAAM